MCDSRIMKQVLWAAEYYKSFLISFRVEGKGELLKEKMIDHICLWVIRLPIRRNGILWIITCSLRPKETESSPGQKFQLPWNTCKICVRKIRWILTGYQILLICSASTLGQTMIYSFCFVEILPFCIINVSRNIKTTARFKERKKGARTVF